MAEIGLSLYLTYFKENRWEHLTNKYCPVRSSHFISSSYITNTNIRARCSVITQPRFACQARTPEAAGKILHLQHLIRSSDVRGLEDLFHCPTLLNSSLLRSGVGGSSSRRRRSTPFPLYIHCPSNAHMRRSPLIWSDNFAWHPQSPRRKERHNGYRLLPVGALGVISGGKGFRGTRFSKSRDGSLSIRTAEAAKCHCQKRPKRLLMCRS